MSQDQHETRFGGFYSLDLVLFEYVVALKQRMDLPRRRFAIE